MKKTCVHIYGVLYPRCSGAVDVGVSALDVVLWPKRSVK